MGCKLLRGLFALFSEQKPYIKTQKQPFLDALASVKTILEQSTNPQWNALAKRLDTASSSPSGAVEHFIYPINGSKEIYLRTSVLKELETVCEHSLESGLNHDQIAAVCNLLDITATILNVNRTPKSEARNLSTQAPSPQ